MKEEEYFRKNYPNSCYGDKPLSPYWDFFQDGVEFGERQSEKKIEKVEYTLKKIIETVQNDKIDEYGARLVLIKDFAYECLEEIEK